MSIEIKPQTVVLNDIVWTMDEIEALQELYGKAPFLNLQKDVIRRSAIMQKALKSGACMATSLQPGALATIFISQSGLDLFQVLK